MTKRVFVWRCDDCGIEIYKETWGLPSGWRVTGIPFEPKKHVCAKCVASYSEKFLLDLKGNPQWNKKGN